MISLCAASTNGSALKAQAADGTNEIRTIIAAIAANTALGDLDTLKGELAGGINAGMSVNEINEILIQMYAYCGFPRSLQGINTFMALIDGRLQSGIDDPRGPEPDRVAGDDRYRQGRETLARLTGVTETAPTGANAFAPGIDLFLKEHLFADVFGRGILSYSDRETATVAALSAMKGVDPMLRSHLGMAMNTGLTEGELREIIRSLEPFIGEKRTQTALSILSNEVENRKSR